MAERASLNKIEALWRTLIEGLYHGMDHSWGKEECCAPESSARAFSAILLSLAADWVLEVREIEALRDGCSPSEAILAS